MRMSVDQRVNVNVGRLVRGLDSADVPSKKFTRIAIEYFSHIASKRECLKLDL